MNKNLTYETKALYDWSAFYFWRFHMKYKHDATHVTGDKKQYKRVNGQWYWYSNRNGWVVSGLKPGYIESFLTPIDIYKEPLNPLGTFDEAEAESSGGSCNYYMVYVNNPTTLKDPYTIECNDLIESLGLSFKEANIIKEIFRTANERTNGNGKPGNTEKRAAEKVLFFAIRHAISNGVDIEKFTSEINLK